MQNYKNRRIIRNIVKKKLRKYKKKLIDEMDLLSEEDKQEMAKEIDKIIQDIERGYRWENMMK